MRMKEFFVKLAFFGLTTSVVYIGMLAMLNSIQLFGEPMIYRATEGVLPKGGDLYCTFRDYDIDHGIHDFVIVGSSHAYRGYDPKNFEAKGFRAFNLGSISQTTCSSLAIIEDIVRKEQSKAILLDIYVPILRLDELESGATLISNVVGDKEAAQIAWNVGDIRALNMWALRVLNRDAEPLPPVDYAYKGYAMKTDSVIEKIFYGRTGRAFEITLKQEDCLRELLKQCNEDDLPIVLISHPRPKQINQPEYDAFSSYFEQLTDEFESHFLDYSFDHNLHSKHHFYDHSHLNKAGVDLFNDRLLIDLDSLGLGKDIDWNPN